MHKFDLIPRKWLLNTVYSKKGTLTRILSKSHRFFIYFYYNHFFQSSDIWNGRNVNRLFACINVEE
ncbi:hypothetical protein E3O61_12035 [Enterococcus faecium]|nr:hypothetical protein E3O61_12035 [Enterococcus faecium]